MKKEGEKMHLHNDAHSHAHEHTHEHEHTHGDGCTHTHEHSHVHSHEHTHDHEHEHDHSHTHEHTHDHEHTHEHHHSHEHEGTPMEELLAMLKYMVGHNASHVKETEELAQQLKDTHAAQYDMIASAVAEFEKGNALLKEALDSLMK